MKDSNDQTSMDSGKTNTTQNPNDNMREKDNFEERYIEQEQERLEEQYIEQEQERLEEQYIEREQERLEELFSNHFDEIEDTALEQRALLRKFTGDRIKSTVRTTFGLSESAFRVLQKFEEELGYSPRGIFKEAVSLLTTFPKDSIQQLIHESDKKTRRTFVLDKFTLQKYNDIAQKLDVSRDAVIEISLKALVTYLDMVIDYEQEKTKEYELAIAQIISECESLRDKAIKDFKEQTHPIPTGIEAATIRLRSLASEMCIYLKTSKWGGED